MWINWPSWSQGASNHLVSGVGGDMGQEIWFLKVIQYNLAHGLGLLHSDTINVPHGVNLAALTSMPTLGVLLSPVTALWGPVASYNVATSLAPALGALAMMWASRRWLTTIWARYVAGLLFGFSPYVMAQNWGHLFLSSVALFPVMAALIHEAVIRQKWNSYVTGFFLGLAFTAQLGLSPELLIDGIFLLFMVSVLYAALNISRRVMSWNFLKPRLLYLSRAGLVTAAIGLGPALLFVNYFTNGPGSFEGPYHSVESIFHLSTDIAQFVIPTSLIHFSFGLANTGDHLGYVLGVGKAHVSDPFEMGGYIGVPLLLVLAGAIVVLRRWRQLAPVYFVAVMSAALSMGHTLHFMGNDTALRGPFAGLMKIKFVDNSIASRWTLFMWFGIALIVGHVVDWLAHHWPQRSRRLMVSAGGILVALGILAVTPQGPYPAMEQQVPHWFTGAAAHEVPDRTVLVTYPIARGGYPLPMMWQAVSGMNFDLFGGAAGPQTSFNSPIRNIIDICESSPNDTLDTTSDMYRGAVAEYATISHPVLVLAPSHSAAVNPGCGQALFNSLSGTKPVAHDDVLVWNLP
jgi:hypothetical protein